MASLLQTKPKKILVLNSLDERYGSTYRIRALRDLISSMGYSLRYKEHSGNPFQKLWMAFWASWGRYDLLFTQKFNPITLTAILIARIRGKKIIVDWDDLDEGLQGNLFKKLLAQICEVMGPRLVSAISTHSEIIFLKAQGFCPTYLVPQGFDEKIFHPQSLNREKIREKWNFYLKDFVVGYLCTFTHGGTLDLETILSAWEKIKDPHVRFFLIGGGPLEPQIRSTLSKLGLSRRVTLSGLIPHEKIPEILSCLDLGIIFMKDSPSNQARVSFKVIEYLAMNIPVVGKVVGVTERKFGKYIFPATEKNLASQIKKFFENPVPSSSRKEIVDLSWNSFIPALQRVLSTTLASKP